MVQGWVWRRAVIGIFILFQTLPIYAWPRTTSLGTARGTRAVELSFGEGKAWLSLGGAPILSCQICRFGVRPAVP